MLHYQLDKHIESVFDRLDRRLDSPEERRRRIEREREEAEERLAARKKRWRFLWNATVAISAAIAAVWIFVAVWR
jgi:hypothetical protein